jgi:hypothetical protein
MGWQHNTGLEPMWTRPLLIATVWAALLIRGPVFGMSIEIQGDKVVMAGPVIGDECTQLSSILEHNEVHTVMLTSSNGGNASAGYCVGELIRGHRLDTVIRGNCSSSCSRMWLGGVSRTLDGSYSHVGLHGNYDNNGRLLPAAPARLQAWIPNYAPVNRNLMERWTALPYNFQIMDFYNDKAMLCDRASCTLMPEWNAHKAGLSTQ